VTFIYITMAIGAAVTVGMIALAVWLVATGRARLPGGEA